MVDQNGRPILDSRGKPIPFKGPPKSKAAGAKGSKGLTPYQQSQRRSEAVTYARELYGEPIEVNRDNPRRVVAKGKYEAQPGKSEFRDGSTNNPRKAQRATEYTFGEAQKLLMETYQVNKAKARSWLIAAGWSPPRPKAKKKSNARPNRTRIQ